MNPIQWLLQPTKLARIWIAGLAAATLSACLIATFLYVQDHGSYENTPPINAKAPFVKEVKEFLAPLRYSGIEAFLRKNATIQLNFAENTWVFKNKWQFDENGMLLLDNGVYGVCGELATFTFQKLGTMFLEQGYEIKIVSVSESGFFPSMLHPSHFILKIQNPKQPGMVYYLDPSFKRYGLETDFENYLFFNEHDPQHFAQKAASDSSFDVGTGSPLLIQKNFAINFSVQRQNNAFELDNFSLGIYAVKKHHYYQKPLFWIFRSKGRTLIGEDREVALEILDDEVYERLRRRIIELYNRILVEKVGLAPESEQILDPEAKATLNLAF